MRPDEDTLMVAQQYFDMDATRVDEARVRLHHASRIPATLFATPDVPIGRGTLTQLSHLLDLDQHLEELVEAGFFGAGTPRIHRAALMPDTHKGPGIPVGCVVETEGFLLPGAVGNDIGCGMRLLTLEGVSPDEIASHIEPFEHRLRALFFAGQRNVPMTPTMRQAMLQDGLAGLVETAHEAGEQGLWAHFDVDTQRDALAYVHRGGRMQAQDIFSFADYIEGSGGLTYDAHIGSVGGGNHFVEVQRVAQVLDGARAWAWGLAPDTVCVMAHSGSVGFGHAVGGHFRRAAYQALPTTCARPPRGFTPLPTTGPHAGLAEAYLDAMANAANFAFANRLVLGLMVASALSDVLGRRVPTRLIYDASHNLMWRHSDRVLHRKGATPALGPEGQGPFAWTGHPVLIPGSMGSSSYVMAGTGSTEAMASACHGAGRAMSRGKARKLAQGKEVAKLRVVTPIDPRAPELRGRTDILEQHRKRVLEEAPSAYKAITPVIETVEEAGIARGVARLEPLLTVKG